MRRKRKETKKQRKHKQNKENKENNERKEKERKEMKEVVGAARRLCTLLAMVGALMTMSVGIASVVGEPAESAGYFPDGEEGEGDSEPTADGWGRWTGEDEGQRQHDAEGREGKGGEDLVMKNTEGISAQHQDLDDSAPGVFVTHVLPDHRGGELKLPMDEEIVVLAAVINEALNPMNITSVVGSINLADDFAFYVQNPPWGRLGSS